MSIKKREILILATQKTVKAHNDRRPLVEVLQNIVTNGRSIFNNRAEDPFKLFLKQFFSLLKEKGQMGIVVPIGIYTDHMNKKFEKSSSNQFVI